MNTRQQYEDFLLANSKCRICEAEVTRIIYAIAPRHSKADT
jgi:hypothetical protein